MIDDKYFFAYVVIPEEAAAHAGPQVVQHPPRSHLWAVF
jgi:hypothetical protein